MNKPSTIATTIALIGGVAISVASPLYRAQDIRAGNLAAQNEEVRKSNLKMNVSGIKHIQLNVEYGEVGISTSNTNEFEAQIVKRVSRPVDSQDQAWLDNPWLKAKRDGDTLTIYEDKAIKPKLNHQSKSKKDNRNHELEVKILVPQGLNADVTVNAGVANIQGDYESFTGNVGAGEMTLKRFQANRFIKANVGAGEFNGNILSVPTEETKVHIGVGEIHFDMKGNASIDARVGVGSIVVAGESDNDKNKGLGEKRHIQVGRGGSPITLDVATGEISVGSGKTTSVTQDKANFDEDFEIQGEISDVLKSAQEEVERSFEINRIDDDEIQREVSKALKDAEVEISKAMGSIDIEISKALKDAEVEVENSTKEANHEMEQAMKELEIELNDQPDINIHVSNQIRQAMAQARKSLNQSLNAAKRALANSKRTKRTWKDHDHS